MIVASATSGGIRSVMAVSWAAALFVLACSSDGSSSSSIPLAPDQSSFQVTWKTDTVVLEEATVKTSLKNPTTTDGIYLFDPSLTQVASLHPGQALMIGGVDLVKVDSVQVGTSAITVTTEPASLLDAATDADVTWDIGMDLAHGSNNAQPIVLPSLRPVQLISQSTGHLNAIPGPKDKLSYNGPLGNLSATGSMGFTATGLQMNATVTFNASPAVMKIAGSAFLLPFRCRGGVVVKGGLLQEAYYNVEGIDLDLDLNIGAVAMGASDNGFKFPIEVRAPYAIGPIPTFVSIGLTITLNPLLSDTSSSKTHAHFHLVGSGGVRIVNGAPSTYGSLENSVATTQDSDAVSTINAGMGVLLEFPKVSFGVGMSQAEIAAYASFKAEVVANEVMRYGGLGLITGNCLTIGGNYGTYAGGAIRLAGFKFSQEMQLWGKATTIYQSGNPDMSVCQ
jgi:hypothetical protein